jgi:hypothetical protein
MNVKLALIFILENSLAEKIPESGDQLWYIQEKTSDAKLS